MQGDPRAVRAGAKWTARPVRAEMLESRVLLSATTVRQDLNIDANWQFFKGDIRNAQVPSYNDSTWTNVSLPHTWNNLDGQDGGPAPGIAAYYRGPGWYRKHLTIPAADAGKELFLQFDGANLITDVYVNGASVGEHIGGYATFRFDVTPYLKVGQDNVLAIKVNNGKYSDAPPLYADYTFDGGLYRDVHLLVTDKVHVNLMDSGSPGVFLTPSNVSKASANLNVASEIKNDAATADNVTIVATLNDATGKAIKTVSSTQTVAAGAVARVTQLMSVTTPHLWNGRLDPYLYSVSVQVSDAGGVHDTVTQPVGFRSYVIDPNKGFILNGAPYDLHGVDMHQDWPNEGWAVTDAQRATDVSLVEEIGATAVRLSHYQYSQQIYNSFDHDGVLVWTEVPLVDSATNSAAFTANTLQQLQELILQNYNHPSVFVWGMFNELAANKSVDPNPLVDKEVALAHALDPTRLTTAATNQVPNSPLNAHTDVIAFNQYYGWYNGQFSDFGRYMDSLHKQFPNRAIGLSEYGAGASIHQHTDMPTRPTFGNNWLAEGRFHPEEYQNLFHEAYWAQIKARPWLWAKFIWNLFDYASDIRDDGDTNGINDKGLVTYDRQTKKDAFYFYKANWSNDAVLYLTDRRFMVRPNSLVNVKVYANTQSATLDVNGKVIGTVSSANAPNGVFQWAGVQLHKGMNIVHVTGVRNGKTYSDSCVWFV